MNKLIILIFIIGIFTSNSFSKTSIKVLYKINDQIITNIDLDNEKKYLIFLNPNLKNLSVNKISEISLDSFKNRKIKEIELSKFFDLSKKEKLGEEYIKNFTTNSNFKNIENLKAELNKVDLSYSFFESNFAIDYLWREFIFNKFKSMIKLDMEKIKNKVENNRNEIEELNLSEILFELDINISFEDLKNKIYSEIEKSGFEATATVYSISNSKNFGGKLGWIKSNQISDKIYKEIKKGKKITDPIKTNNGYLIIKLNEKRKISEEIDIKAELQKLINIETEKELNKFGYIYFNKIKKRTFVSEN